MYCKPFPSNDRVICVARISRHVSIETNILKIDLMALKAGKHHGGYISG
jgi:hypothetical protein